MVIIWRGTLLVVLALSSLAVAAAQNSTPVEQLRSQLSDLEAKETELQARLKQLDEDLRPENIEKFFALSGSTHPEDLRAERRRQLESQKASVQAQLDQLAASRTRLEAAISTAEVAPSRQTLPADTPDQPSEVDAGKSLALKAKPKGRTTHRRRARRLKRRG